MSTLKWLATRVDWVGVQSCARPSLCAGVVAAAVVSSALADPGITALDIGVETRVNAISADGETIVGYFRQFNNGPTRAFRWNAHSGALDLDLPFARATGVSADGAIVWGFVPPTGQLFRWTEQTGVQLFASPGDLNTTGGCSADGRFVAGTAVIGQKDVAYRWSEASGVITIEAPWNCFGPGWIVADLRGGISFTGDNLVASGDFPVTGPGGGLVSYLQALLWSSGGGTTHLSASRSCATAISGDGHVAAGFTVDPSTGGISQTVVWGAGATDLGAVLPGVLFYFPTALSGDGSIVGGGLSNYTETGSSGAGWIRTPTLGTVVLNTYLPSIGIDLQGWQVSAVRAISMDGQTFAAEATRSGENHVLFIDLRRDTDGDGLYDDWEINGIPYFDHEGQMRRYLLVGANPLRKDIYVEADWMIGERPLDNAINRVKAAFNDAPVAAPPVLGGVPGIALHVDIADDGFEARDYHTAWTEFFIDKSGHFGTDDERRRSDWIQLKGAKSKAYRYCIFAKSLPDSTAGIGELDTTRPALGPRMGGNDFEVALHYFVPNPFVTLEEKQASVFMHELGHTLGLYHGGGVAGQNLNPNHYSTMNYMWNGVRLYAPISRRNLLDYARVGLPSLNETGLLESFGIGGPDPTVRVPYFVSVTGIPAFCTPDPDHPPTPGGCDAPYDSTMCVRYASFTGPVDWNNDGVISGVFSLVCADPNGDAQGDALVSVNEWDLLAYNFRESPGYSDLVEVAVPRCPTLAEEAFFESLPPAPPDPVCPGPAPVAQAPAPATGASCGQTAAQFTVGFTGTGPFTLHWRWRDASQIPPTWVDLAEGTMAGGTLVKGTDARTLRISTASKQDFHGDTVQLSCRVTDACGQSADSPACTLLVGGPTASANSPYTATPCPGGAATFSVSASSSTGPLNYQWSVLGNPVPTLADGPMAFGTMVLGSHGPTLTLSRFNSHDFAFDFQTVSCEVSDACGTVELFDFELVGSGVGITRQPQTLNLPCSGTASAVFVIEAVGPPPVMFQWTRDGVPLADGGRISGAVSPTLTIDSPTGADSAVYRCTVTSACASVISRDAALWIGPPRLPPGGPAVYSACTGAYRIIEVSPLGSLPYTIQWMRDGVDLNDSAVLFGTHSAQLFIAGVGPADFASYSVRLHNSCGDMISPAAILSPAQPVEIGSPPVGGSVCAGGTTTLTIQPSQEQPSLRGDWLVEDPTNPGDFEYFDDVQGPLMFGSMVCGWYSGAYTRNLSITLLGAPSCPTSYRFVGELFVADCGRTLSDPVTVTLCRADINCSGALSVQDIFDFLAAYFGNDPRADFNVSGAISVQDIFDYLAAYFAGCP